MVPKKKLWVAIDPGTRVTGFAVFNHKLCLEKCGLLDVSDLELSPFGRRKAIGAGIEALLLYLEADAANQEIEVICEEPVMQGKANQQMQRLLGIFEAKSPREPFFYHPMTVKKTFGSGKLEKDELAFRVKSYVESFASPEGQRAFHSCYDKEQWDVTDAVAIGFCHFLKTNQLEEIKCPLTKENQKKHSAKTLRN